MSQILYPEDINRLCAVFDTVCRNHRIEPDSAATLDVAADLVRLFQAGIADDTALRIAIEARLTLADRLAG